MDVADEVKLVIAKTLKMSTEQLSDETRLQDVGAESIDIIEIVFELEEKFDIDLTVKARNQPADEAKAANALKLEDFRTVGDVCRAINAIVDTETRE